jgi:hypothetical protein
MLRMIGLKNVQFLYAIANTHSNSMCSNATGQPQLSPSHTIILRLEIFSHQVSRLQISINHAHDKTPKHQTRPYNQNLAYSTPASTRTNLMLFLSLASIRFRRLSYPTRWCFMSRITSSYSDQTSTRKV